MILCTILQIRFLAGVYVDFAGEVDSGVILWCFGRGWIAVLICNEKHSKTAPNGVDLRLIGVGRTPRTHRILEKIRWCSWQPGIQPGWPVSRTRFWSTLSDVCFLTYVSGNYFYFLFLLILKISFIYFVNWLINYLIN